MFTWAHINDTVRLPELIRELNVRMRNLWVLLNGVRRDGRKLIMVGAAQIEGGVIFRVMVDPPAPDAGYAVLYVRDAGGGKLEVCIRYPSAIEILNTEP